MTGHPLQPMPDGPEVGEEGLKQRFPQELDARAAAGAELVADGPLHGLDVAVAPLLQALVEVDEELGQLRGPGVLGVDGDEQVRLRLRRVVAEALQVGEVRGPQVLAEGVLDNERFAFEAWNPDACSNAGAKALSRVLEGIGKQQR